MAPSAFVLSAEQSDTFLESILPCDSDIEYQRALVEFGRMFNRPAQLSLTEGENWLRRRAKRRTDYTQSPGTSAFRSKRSGKFSWTELKVLQWSRYWRGEGKQEPTPEYLAGLLWRDVKEIELELDRLRNTRHGMEVLF